MLGKLLAVSYAVVFIHGMMISALVSVRLPRKLPCNVLRPSLHFSGRFASRGFATFATEESTDVSQHFRVEPDELLNVLKKFGTDIRAKPDGQFELKECKLCTKRNKDKPDNLWKLNVWPSGSYNCFRCSSSGNWYDLKNKAAGCEGSCGEQATVFNVGGKASSNRMNSSTSDKDKAPSVIPNQTISSKVYYNLFPEASPKAVKETELDVTRRTQVKEYLNTVRGLHDEVLKKYNIGYAVQQFLSNDNEWVDQVCITFPWQVGPDVLEGKELKYTATDDANSKRDSTIVRIKYRALVTKGLQRILPKGGMWAFFGWHTVPVLASGALDAESIIITEGEYDCMAVSQALSQLPESDSLRNVPAVSLPNGCNSLPTELIPLLERFEKIYLWLDNDKSGQEAAAKFVQKLGAQRCVVVKPLEDSLTPPKDANDALRQDPQLIPLMLRAAQKLTQDSTIGFSEGRDSVLQSVLRGHALGQDGSLTPSLPQLTEICKGFRRGELVILTGPTGSGKTTLLSQLSLDFAQQGKPVLWGSFEIKNTRLMAKMLQQYHKSAALSSLSSDKVQAVANDFEALPVRFLNFHGSTHIDKVMDAMDQAVYKDDVQHIIIDNLQFMMPDSLYSTSAPTEDGPQGKQKSSRHSSSFEKFDYMDGVVNRLRKFATEKNVNIVLVIHPRKEEEDTKLTMSSIFGTAKATQEADIVLILQRYAGKNFLEVKKNRYDGVTGKVDLTFNSTSICYEDRTARDKDKSNNPVPTPSVDASDDSSVLSPPAVRVLIPAAVAHTSAVHTRIDEDAEPAFSMQFDHHTPPSTAVRARNVPTAPVAVPNTPAVATAYNRNGNGSANGSTNSSAGSTYVKKVYKPRATTATTTSSSAPIIPEATPPPSIDDSVLDTAAVHEGSISPAAVATKSTQYTKKTYNTARSASGSSYRSESAPAIQTATWSAQQTSASAAYKDDYDLKGRKAPPAVPTESATPSSTAPSSTTPCAAPPAATDSTVAESSIEAATQPETEAAPGYRYKPMKERRADRPKHR